MAILEKTAVTPTKPKFYTRFVDGIFCRMGKYKPDDFYHKMNKYHCNIMLTVEKGPYKFLDIKLYMKKGQYYTEVYHRMTKFPKNWVLKTP